MISFVGAGPGAADLMTIRGAGRLGAADVIIWASSLVPEDVLGHARPGAEIHDSAVMTLEDVLALYEANPPPARVVRLASGDPSIYGALAEQIDWCRTQGREFEIVPGVSSLGAAAAALEVELTVPGVAQAVVLARLAGRTGALDSPCPLPPGQSVTDLAAAGATMAVFLSAARGSELSAALLHPPSRYQPETPAAVVVRASRPDQVVERTTIAGLAATLDRLDARVTTLILVGPALAAPLARSRLYSPDYAHAHRRRSLPGTTIGRPASSASSPTVLPSTVPMQA
ncbi:MAG: cobalt-precorrin-4/precorrin-4 C(11)-methyltransferase [Acidimicrobiales bacterium]